MEEAQQRYISHRGLTVCSTLGRDAGFHACVLGG